MRFPESHDEGKFLEGAIELSMNIITKKLRAERYFLPEPAKPDDQVESQAAFRPRWQSVDRARAFQRNAPPGKPIGRIPVFRRQVLAQRNAETSEIKIAVILRFKPRVIDAQERHRFGSGRQFHHSEKTATGSIQIKPRESDLRSPQACRRPDSK